MLKHDDIAAAFGQVLRERRTAKHLSQEALALAAGVDRTFVSQLERGLRQPTLTTLVRLARALGTRPTLLVADLERSLG